MVLPLTKVRSPSTPRPRAPDPFRPDGLYRQGGVTPCQRSPRTPGPRDPPKIARVRLGRGRGDYVIYRLRESCRLRHVTRVVGASHGEHRRSSRTGTPLPHPPTQRRVGSATRRCRRLSHVVCLCLCPPPVCSLHVTDRSCRPERAQDLWSHLGRPRRHVLPIQREPGRLVLRGLHGHDLGDPGRRPDRKPQ